MQNCLNIIVYVTEDSHCFGALEDVCLLTTAEEIPMILGKERIFKFLERPWFRRFSLLVWQSRVLDVKQLFLFLWYNWRVCKKTGNHASCLYLVLALCLWGKSDSKYHISSYHIAVQNTILVA